MTLWTSSDNGDPEAAAAGDAPKEAEKAVEPETKADEPATEAAPAPES